MLPHTQMHSLAVSLNIEVACPQLSHGYLGRSAANLLQIPRCSNPHRSKERCRSRHAICADAGALAKFVRAFHPLCARHMGSHHTPHALRIESLATTHPCHLLPVLESCNPLQ